MKFDTVKEAFVFYDCERGDRGPELLNAEKGKELGEKLLQEFFGDDWTTHRIRPGRRVYTNS